MTWAIVEFLINVVAHVKNNESTDLEGESVDIGLIGSTLDNLGGLESGPPFGERRELDQVPNVGQGLYDEGIQETVSFNLNFLRRLYVIAYSLDDGGLGQVGRGRNSGRHFDELNWFDCRVI